MGSLTPILSKSLPMGTALIRILLFPLLILLFPLFILPLYIKLPRQHNFLTRFSCNKEYVFYSDYGFWKVLAEPLVFNVNSCFVYLL